MTARSVTLEFYREAFGFNVAHFTLFSSTERERWHGHNYSVYAAVTATINEPGITFDYAIFKKKLTALCASLNSYFVIAENSPYLDISAAGDYYHVTFNDDKMIFLKKDVLLLPIANTTLEDFSQWFIDQLAADQTFLRNYHIQEMVIKVFNGPTQSANAVWRDSVAQQR